MTLIATMSRMLYALEEELESVDDSVPRGTADAGRHTLHLVPEGTLSNML